jgi:hypothetical protein
VFDEAGSYQAAFAAFAVLNAAVVAMLLGLRDERVRGASALAAEVG